MKKFLLNWKKHTIVSIINIIIGFIISFLTLAPGWYPILKEWYRTNFEVTVHNEFSVFGQSIKDNQGNTIRKYNLLCGSDSKIHTIDTAFFITVTNKMESSSMIGGYTIEKYIDGKYVPLRRIPCYNKALIFNKSVKQYWDLFPNFDHTSFRKSLSKGESLQGWVFMEHINVNNIFSGKDSIKLRITIFDIHGKSTTSSETVMEQSNLNVTFPQAGVRTLDKPNWN